MTLNQMNCCAFNEIDGLSEHSTPEDAMTAFCQDVTTSRYTPTYKLVTKLELGAFYIFTAVVRSDDESGGHYGYRFAAYIREHKLGCLKETMSRVNRKNEPGHLVKGWIWAPSEAGLKAWWKKHGGSDGC